MARRLLSSRVPAWAHRDGRRESSGAVSRYDLLGPETTAARPRHVLPRFDGAQRPARRPGTSVRLKLTLSYAVFLLIAGVLLLGAVWVFLLRGQRGLFFVPTLTDFGRALDPRNFGARIFVPSAIMVFAFLLVFGLAGGWFLAGRVLAPLSRITEAVHRTESGSLSHRIELHGRHDEFRELADSFDSMLARLEAHVGEQQRFVSNASHELRTPLAITKALLDVALSDPVRRSDELDDRLREVNARAIDLTEALLLLSRADQRSFTLERVDLSLVAEEAAETLLPLAEKSGVLIETTGDVVVTHGSRALLTQLMSNLVQNAIVHNLPERGTVHVNTRSGAELAEIVVENTGEQLEPELVSTLAESFRRGTERVHGDHAGVGLGLTIAKSIVQAHDGTLRLAPRPGGGLCVTVLLPAIHTF